MAELASLVTRAILEAVAQNSAGLPRALGGDLRGQLARLGRVRVKLPAGLGGETAKGVQERLRGTAGEVGRRLKGLGSQLRKDRSQD